MAVREGICPNCGSLLKVNDQDNTVTCVFCWGTSSSNKAIRLAQGLEEDYEYPNEEFEELHGEERAQALKKQGMGGVIVKPEQSLKEKNKAKIARNKRKAGKLTPKEKVALENKPIVQPKVSRKHKIYITVGIIAFILIIVAIGLPTYLTRTKKEEAITARLDEVISFADSENRVDIQRQDNHVITLVSPDEVSEEEAKEVFENYADVYKDVYEISLDEAKEKIEVRLLDAKTGGYYVDQEDGELTVEDLEKVAEEESDTK